VDDRRLATGDGGRETGEELFIVHIEDPPFFGFDAAAEVSTVSEYVAGFQSQLKNISYEERNPQFRGILCNLVRWGAEDWKDGSMEGWNVSTFERCASDLFGVHSGDPPWGIEGWLGVSTANPGMVVLVLLGHL
jgi:hypothetical protein